MSKHTPGPWEVRIHRYAIADTGDYDANIEVRANGKAFAQLFGSDDQDEADARLIAAAPDLLEALHALLFTADDGPSYDAAITQARAAIAKAEAV